MHTLLLYTTAGCHLCDEAEQLLNGLLDRQWWQLQAVEISDSAELTERYGVHIPVLGFSDKQLFWPFNAEQVITFLQEVLQDAEAYGCNVAK